MKHCQLDPNVRCPIRSNAVMWLYDYRYIVKASDDDPNPFSFRFPLFWTLGAIRKQDPATFSWRKSPSNSPKPSLPGGWHFSYTLFPAAFYMKMASMAESGGRRFFTSITAQRVQHVHQELQSRRNTAFPWGTKAVTHPKCLAEKYPMYKDMIMKVPWLVAQNAQQFAFFVPCQPALYDAEGVLQASYQDCARLFGA
jgi:hypothetical protein